MSVGFEGGVAIFKLGHSVTWRDFVHMVVVKEIFPAKMGSWVEPSGSGGGRTELAVGLLGKWSNRTRSKNAVRLAY